MDVPNTPLFLCPVSVFLHQSFFKLPLLPTTTRWGFFFSLPSFHVKSRIRYRKSHSQNVIKKFKEVKYRNSSTGRGGIVPFYGATWRLNSGLAIIITKALCVPTERVEGKVIRFGLLWIRSVPQFRRAPSQGLSKPPPPFPI